MKFFLIFILIISISGCAVIQEPENVILPEKVYYKNMENSLWPGENSNNMLFVDNKARQLDDILTILIEEESKAQKNANTETSKKSDVLMGVKSLFGLQRSNPLTLTAGSLGAGTNNKFKGNGKTTRSGKLQAIVTAKIINVLTNGNFIVKGKREIKVNNENQLMTITGIIRPNDVTSNNTILSRYIADAKITYSGVGVLNDRQRPGWALKILSWVWPF